MTGLGTLPDCDSSDATAINNHGQITPCPPRVTAQLLNQGYVEGSFTLSN